MASATLKRRLTRLEQRYPGKPGTGTPWTPQLAEQPEEYFLALWRLIEAHRSGTVSQMLQENGCAVENAEAFQDYLLSEACQQRVAVWEAREKPCEM